MIENIFELMCAWFNSVKQRGVDADCYDNLYFENDVYGIKLPFHYVEDILNYCDELNSENESMAEEICYQKDYIRLLKDERNRLHNENLALKSTQEGLKS